MNLEKPEFKLSRIASEDLHQPPCIISVEALSANGVSDRRSFLGASISAAAALLFLRFERAAAMLAPAAISSPRASEGRGVTVLGITPDGRNLISLSGPDEISVWSLPEGELLVARRFHNASDCANQIVMPRGDTHAVRGEARDLMLLATTTELLPTRLRDRVAGQPIKATAVTSDGKMLACAYACTIDVWSLTNDRLLAKRPVKSGDVKALALAAGGATLAYVSSSGMIVVSDLANGVADGARGVDRRSSIDPLIISRGEQLSQLRDYSDPSSPRPSGSGGIWPASDTELKALALSPDGLILSAGYNNGAILIWSFPQSRRRGRRRRGARRCRGCGSRAPSGRRSYGGTITTPCTPTPVPAGYVCTCNCVRM